MHALDNRPYMYLKSFVVVSILNKRQLYLHVLDLERNLLYIRHTRVNQFAIPLQIIGNQYQIKLPKLSHLFYPSILFMPQDGISRSYLLLSGILCTESMWFDNIKQLETMLNPSMLGHFMQNYFSIMLHFKFLFVLMKRPIQNNDVNLPMDAYPVCICLRYLV